MTPRAPAAVACGAMVAVAACACAQPPTAEERAVAFLAAEVPKWARENHCYSCHNNGDAARALVAAARGGLLAQGAPLADTLRFLAAPQHWDANGPEGPFKDKKLARIQFAAALADAARFGLIDDRAALAAAAALVAEIQTTDGSWQTDEPGTIGSPATYGQALASALAMRVLRVDGSGKHDEALAKARRWFETTEPRNVLDAAATLLALADDRAPAAPDRRARAMKLIRRGQADDGGWGPFVNAPPEVFDTAIVLLALEARRDPSDLVVQGRIAAGRRYLLARQRDDGSWPATTRPPGAESYAQQLSTSAWATLALVATRRAEPAPSLR